MNVVSVQCINDRLVLTDPILLASGNPFRYHVEVLSLPVQPMLPPNPFQLSPSVGWMSRRFIERCVHIFL